jgi:hypothetical protein
MPHSATADGTDGVIVTHATYSTSVISFTGLQPLIFTVYPTESFCPMWYIIIVKNPKCRCCFYLTWSEKGHTLLTLVFSPADMLDCLFAYLYIYR